MTTNLAQVAKACGYREAFVCGDVAAFDRALQQCAARSGPIFVTCKINSLHPTPLPRVTSRYTPEENLQRVRAAIQALSRGLLQATVESVR
jgi:phosphonopyruvate decarboxylase